MTPTKPQPKIKWAGYGGIEERAYHERKAATMREMFRQGLDTREISYRIKLPEAAVYNALAAAREAERRR